MPDCPCPYCNGYDYDAGADEEYYLPTPSGKTLEEYSHILKEAYIPHIRNVLNNSTILLSFITKKEKGEPESSP